MIVTGKAHHVSVFRELVLTVEVEPRVPCVCVLGLVLILVGKEFDSSTFADFGVFDPVSGAFAMPLGGSFNVGWKVVCCTTFDDGVDFSGVSKDYVDGCQLLRWVLRLDLCNAPTGVKSQTLAKRVRLLGKSTRSYGKPERRGVV